jgi:phage repressor protein C with HTH and peptisase S24 domain
MTNPNVRADNSDDGLTSRDSQGADSNHSDAARIRDALHALGPGHDVPWLAKEAGIPSSTIYDNLKRGISKPAVAVSIAAALGVSVDWLLTGSSPASERSDSSAVTRDAALAERFGLKLIPEVDITYSLGGGAIAVDNPDSRMVPFRQDWLDRLTRGFKADVFLTRGQGDSMMPTILDDDDVLVNRADNVVRQQDRIWALGYGELGMIKRVRRLPSGQFQLNSDNPAVSAIEATEDELFVVGRVIWIGRRV